MGQDVVVVEASVIGSGSRFRGDLTASGPVRVAGVVEGSILGATALHVVPGGRCQGNVQAGEATIEGEVEGDVVVDGAVTLGATARVQGDVRAAGIGVAVGAKIAGRVLVGWEGEAAKESAAKVPSSEAEAKPLKGVLARPAGRKPAEFTPDAGAGDWLSRAGVTASRPAWMDEKDASAV